MNAYDDSQITRLKALLIERESELRSQLNAADAARSTLAEEHAAHEVTDFKDAANDEAMILLDDLQASHATRELQQVLAARARMDKREYGSCQGCGKAIDLPRLLALPSAALCAHCQTQQELR